MAAAANTTEDGVPNMDTGWAVGIEQNIFVRIFYGCIATVGITGNFLVCFALIRVPALRSRASQLIVHLSVIDMIDHEHSYSEVCSLIRIEEHQNEH